MAWDALAREIRDCQPAQLSWQVKNTKAAAGGNQNTGGVGSGYGLPRTMRFKPLQGGIGMRALYICGRGAQGGHQSRPGR